MDIKTLNDLNRIFGEPGQEKFSSMFNNFHEVWKKIRIIGQYNSLSFGKLLHLYPFSEKDWKIFDKLDKNGKFGYLSKHLLRCARKAGISQTYLQRYLKHKESWKFAKRVYRLTDEKNNKLKEVVQGRNFEKGLPMIVDMKEDHMIFMNHLNNLYHSTMDLIEATIELKLREQK